jgi:hypothetical protein
VVDRSDDDHPRHFEGERLVVVTTGNRGSDFTVTFDPTADGRGLQMTRTISEEGLRQPVTVRSVYRRLSDEARWNIEVDDRPGSYTTGGATDDYAVRMARGSWPCSTTP